MTSVRESISADDGGRAAKSIQVTLHTIRRRGELLFPEGRRIASSAPVSLISSAM